MSRVEDSIEGAADGAKTGSVEVRVSNHSVLQPTIVGDEGVMTTWTVVFELHGMNDTADEVAEAVNGLVGARLNRTLAEHLAGWRFGEPSPEDHGWHSDALLEEGAKRVIVDLVTCPELDEADAEGGAAAGRWRVVIGVDTGLFRKITEARRVEHLKLLARDVHGACVQLGAKRILWEVGGP